MAYHVIPYEADHKPQARWAVKHSSSERISSPHRTKKAAIKKAKKIARKHTGNQVHVHRGKSSDNPGTLQYALENEGTRKSPRWVRV